MGVGVDHARQDDPAAHVDGLARRAGEVLLHRGDAAVRDRDVGDAVEAGGRVDDVAAAQDQVEGGEGHGASRRKVHAKPQGLFVPG